MASSTTSKEECDLCLQYANRKTIQRRGVTLHLETIPPHIFKKYNEEELNAIESLISNGVNVCRKCLKGCAGKTYACSSKQFRDFVQFRINVKDPYTLDKIQKRRVARKNARSVLDAVRERSGVFTLEVPEFPTVPTHEPGGLRRSRKKKSSKK